jgi:hypothetical protein
MEYFFRCNGNFIINMEKILHEIDSIWKNYYIIKFLWNKYYARTNISSQYRWSLFVLLCNQCQSPLMFWVRIPFMASCTRFNIMWTSLSVMYDRWMVVSGYSSTNKTDRHNIIEKLLKVVINTLTLTLTLLSFFSFWWLFCLSVDLWLLITLWYLRFLFLKKSLQISMG